MNVSELMVRPAFCCAPTDSIDRAAQIMWEHDCGCVPVIAAGGALVGVVTDRDACMAAYTTGLPLAAIPVERAMGTPVLACRPDDTVASALELMAAHRIRRLPVLDDADRLVGMLSLGDVIRAKARRARRPDELLRALASVTTPRRAGAEPLVEIRPARRSPAAARPGRKKAASAGAKKASPGRRKKKT